MIEYRHRDQNDDHQKQGRCRAAVQIVGVAEELRFDQVTDQIVINTAQHTADNEGADRRDENHRRSGYDTGHTEGEKHAVKRCEKARAKVARRLDHALVDLCHDRVKRKDHERNIVIYHTENNGTRRIDQLHGGKTHAVQKRIDNAVILQNRLPCVSAEKEIHPHGKHDQHGHHFLSCKAESGHGESERIRKDKAQNRCDRRERNTLDQSGKILARLLNVRNREIAGGIGKSKISDQKKRNDREKDHPYNVRVRGPSGIEFQPLSPP